MHLFMVEIFRAVIFIASAMGKSGSSHFRDPPLISEESPLKSEAVLIKYLDFWDC